MGQVTAVPLGSGIAARVPIDLLQDAQEVFRRRAPQFKFPELPIELRSGDRSHILYRGTAQVDGYRVKIERCIETCDGASSECASISLDRACDGCCQRHCPVAQNGLTPRLSGSTTGRNTAEKPPGELRNREKLVPALLRSASGELCPLDKTYHGCRLTENLPLASELLKHLSPPNCLAYSVSKSPE